MARLSASRRLLAAPFSGALLALAFPPHWSPAAVMGIAALLLIVLGARVRVASLCGFLSGAAFYTLTLPWIYSVMRVYGGLPAGPAAGVLALMVTVLSLFTAVFAGAVAWLGQKSAVRACLAAPFLWVALEYGRTHMPVIGFPWNLLGYAASGHLALLQLAAVTGIYGLSFVVAGYSALTALLFLSGKAGRGRPALAAFLGVTLVLILLAAFGQRWVPHERPRHLARLVQTNFPQSSAYPPDWMEIHAPEMDVLERLSVTPGERPYDLVIWPETPAPFSLQDPRFAARAERIARAARGNLLLGVAEWRARPAASGPGPSGDLVPYNSAALLDPLGRRVFVYDKIHLVPFGEYVPLRRWLTFAKKLTAEVGDFQPGSDCKVGELPGSGRFGIFICFEAVFPNEVRRFVVNGAGLLVNISNDGWFGRSAAPEQHLAMARVRAVENRRWLLRATNNGHTVVADPYGRYVARLAPDVRAALDAPYGFRSDLTFYARWGDWVAWLCVVAAAAALAGNRRRAKTEGGYE